MPHVLIWLMVFMTPTGPLQVVVTTSPFASLEACKAWDDVPLVVRSSMQGIHTESKCVPDDKVPADLKSPEKKTNI